MSGNQEPFAKYSFFGFPQAQSARADNPPIGQSPNRTIEQSDNQTISPMTAIEFNNVSKQYRLGLVSTGTLAHDLNRFWQTRILGREDPYLKIGETNDRASKGESEYVWALKDIDFKVEQGDVVGIIGRNGAGKSTLLKLLSRVTSPTTGTIRARGRIASLLEVGTGFHPEMTGRENIYMNGSIMGMRKYEIDRKLDEIVDFSGCERYLDTPVKRYSSGMTVRLGFAIAAHLEPDILVVDEVLAVGDAEFQKKAVGKMQDVAQGAGRTVLFVSHNMAAVRNLCKSGIVLKHGAIEFSGTASECIDHYIESNSDSFVTHHVIAPSEHEKWGSGEIVFTEISMTNPSPSIATDEPIELLFKMHKQYGVIRNCKFTITIDDESDQRIMGYVTDTIEVPQDREDFTVKLQLDNHSLTPRRYKINMAVGHNDYGVAVRHYDCVNSGLLKFEVKYKKMGTNVEYSYWNKAWGPIMHQGRNISVCVE